ncbi:hypothetical protein M3Y97_00533100 [Aphelenchoides bicaudatus]|nr:hypothetical protein M3Y97_00533100 [Aphelenchoides bicaudatus]
MAAWCMLTTVVNIIFNEFSMTRFFEIYQEFGFTVLFIFLGAFAYQTDSRGLCIATQIIILFFINFVSTIFVVMSFLATCLIRNVIEHLTSFHWVIGFVLPILVATISVIAGYFSCSDFFGLQAPHCFAYTRTKQFWSFVVPVWILFLALNCANIYSFTMCKLSRLEEINLSELYWAFKTCKVTTLLFAFTMTAYFSLMFAADIQLVWLHVLYFVTTLLLAPMIFISHTFTHVQTCISLFALTSLPFYKPCPPPSQTKHEQDFGLIFSLRMKIPFTNAPPNTAEDFVPPTVIQYSEHVMEEMLVIETPPLLRTNKRRPKRFLTNQTVFNLQPPPIVNW